jgi:hypothetical protein
MLLLGLKGGDAPCAGQDQTRAGDSSDDTCATGIYPSFNYDNRPDKSSCALAMRNWEKLARRLSMRNAIDSMKRTNQVIVILWEGMS